MSKPGLIETQKILQKIAGILPQIEQEDEERIDQLQNLVDSLGHKKILNTKNESNKLLLACIYSDILRIYAPEQPYEDNDTLTKIFKLIIEQLDGVQNPSDHEYEFHFRVLELFDTVQSYIVMNDLENETLLLSLTKQLFKITKQKTIKIAVEHITNILCGVINDIEVIPEDFLQFILDRLIEPIRSKNPTEYDLAMTVIRKQKDDLKLAIEEYINNTIKQFDDELLEIEEKDEDKNDDNKDRTEQEKEKEKQKKKRAMAKKQRQKKKKILEYKQKLQIITELASISTDFLDNSLLTLEECLQNENLQIRLLYVDMFASIFTQSSPSLSREWSSLFRIFLKRYDDVSIEIREFMANITKVLFQTQHQYIREIQEFCSKRIEDYNEKVRLQIIKQVCTASIQSSSQDPSNIISKELQKKLMSRMLDKKQSVRYCAIEYGAKLFGQHLRSFWRNNESLPHEMRSLLPIPKRLIIILNSVDLNTKIFVEKVFDENMIGFQTNHDIEEEIGQRINVILGIIALLPDESKKQFQKFFMTQKYQLHSLINKIITTYDNLRMAKGNNKNIEIDIDQDGDIAIIDDENKNKNKNKNKDDVSIRAMQKQYEVTYSNFNQRFAIYGSFRHIHSMSNQSSSNKTQKQRPSDYLRQLIENPNGKIRHSLQKLCSPQTKLKISKNCAKNLKSAVAEYTENTKKSKHRDIPTKELTKLNEFASSLSIRLSNLLFSYDTIPILLDKLVNIVENENGQPRILLTAGIFILNSLCDEIPNIFDHHDCLQQLIKLFNFSNTPNLSNNDSYNLTLNEIALVSLRILAKSITQNSLNQYDAKQEFINDLIEKSKSSLIYKEGQLATECLIKCMGKYSSTVQQLCNECSKELDINEQYLPTLLSSLSLIAKLSPNVFISKSNHIITFILETLLPYDLSHNDDNDGIYEENRIQSDQDKDSQTVANDDNDDHDEDIDIKQNSKRNKRRSKSTKSSKQKPKIKKENTSLTPRLLTSKQCGIKILVNYLLSIQELTPEQLGMTGNTTLFGGISPIKSESSKGSPSRSPKRKRRRRRNKASSIDINLDDVSMEDTDHQSDNINDDNDDDINLIQNENDVQMMEDTDPFSQEQQSTITRPISPEVECDRILDSLFQIIEKYGQIKPEETLSKTTEEQNKTTRKYSRGGNENDIEKKTKTKTKRKRHRITMEEVQLVNNAVDGILEIIRYTRYRRLLGLMRFYQLAFLIHHRNEQIRKHTLASFWNKLKDHRLPSHYSCILPLVAVDLSKKLRDIYRPAVQKFFARMRKENEIRAGGGSLSNLQISKLPEYILFYLIHLLSYHPDFDEREAKHEIRDSAKTSKKKKEQFAGWRGRRPKKSDLTDSEYDTSPSRMIKKKKKSTKQDTKKDEKKDENENENENDDEKNDEQGKEKKKESDKQEADDDDEENKKEDNDEMDEDQQRIKEEEEEEVLSPDETTYTAYFGTIFDFYFDALLKGTKSNQFPLMIKILNKIEVSYDTFKPQSRAHRYLLRIAYERLQKKMRNKKFQEFPGNVPLPKAIYKLRDTTSSYDNSGNRNSPKRRSSPRRTEKSKSRRSTNRQNRNRNVNTTLLATDQSLLATTTTASDSTLTTKKKKKKGIFTSDIFKKKYGANLGKDDIEKKSEEIQENGSDHPSDNDIMNDMPDVNISDLNLTATVRESLNESLIEKGDKNKNNSNKKRKTKDNEVDNDTDNAKIVSSGSGAEADDETNIATTSSKKKSNKKTRKNIGRKRTRVEMKKDDDEDDDIGTSDESGKSGETKDGDDDQIEPPKKRSRRRVTRKK